MQSLLTAYERGENIMKLLQEGKSEEEMTRERIRHIEVAYDLQAGSYVRAMQNTEHRAQKSAICQEMAELVHRYIPQPKTLLKGGVGEAVTLVPFLDAFPNSIENLYGFDISWSRLQYARQFLDENAYPSTQLCVGALQALPFVNDAFDLIMTSHALEPNGGDEHNILEELFRVSAGIVALFEPSYEFADEVGKKRIIEKGYIKHLDKVAESVGFDVLYYAPLSSAINPQNPTAALVLHKPNAASRLSDKKYACPQAKTSLIKKEGGYFSDESFLFYPIVSDVPVLRVEHALLASAMYAQDK